MYGFVFVFVFVFLIIADLYLLMTRLYPSRYKWITRNNTPDYVRYIKYILRKEYNADIRACRGESKEEPGEKPEKVESIESIDNEHHGELFILLF